MSVSTIYVNGMTPLKKLAICVGLSGKVCVGRYVLSLGAVVVVLGYLIVDANENGCRKEGGATRDGQRSGWC